MPNLNAAINEQIRRVSRREIKGSIKTVKRAAGQYRRDIAALKRQIAQLTKVVGLLQKRLPGEAAAPSPEVLQKSRLRIDGLKAHRTRLGLSAKDYGRLMGVSGLTVYNWEAGKSKPRRSQLPRIVAVRGIEKREAMQRLGMGVGSKAESSVSSEPKPAGPRRRRAFSQTAQKMVESLLKSQKTMTSAQINARWEKAGRLGNADNTLSVMTKARKLVRTKADGQRGSVYRLP